jgi:diadenosine tetraphosphate (Ap4A) HIT family hydrolase
MPPASETKPCPFCNIADHEVLLAGVACLFLEVRDPILIGSGIIVPRAHRETVFDLTADEWTETRDLLHRARALLDRAHRPHGYNVGWNSGAVAGQEVFHVHLHVIPRYADEPLAGRGIRYALKQPINRRPGR